MGWKLRMKIRLLTLITFFVIVLCSCTARSQGGPAKDSSASTTSGGTDQAAGRLSLASTSAEIQQAMLSSALHWQTIWMDGVVTYFAEDQTAQSMREQVWIEQATPKFRILSSGLDTNIPETYKACDGMSVLEMNLTTGQSQSYPVPDGFRVGQFVPTLQPGMAAGNPIWSQMGTRISQMAFPSDFAQNEGIFKAVGLDLVAGRETLMMEWTYSQNSLPSWKLWLDTETAVILKAQFFQKSGGEPIMNERVVNQVVYNAVFDDSLFRPPSTMPQFENTTHSMVGSNGIPVAADQINDLGQLYFFTLPHQEGQSPQMVRMPGDCVVGRNVCQQLEIIPAPFPFSFNLSAMSWSPDGKLAAFAYSDNPKGTPTKLFLFDPASAAWTSLAEFPYIDPPFWSPDGTWIAFRIQDGVGGEDIYVVHRDGTELKNLTATGSLPVEGRPYVMDGWLTENVLVRSALPGTQGGIYLLRAGDGTARRMFESLLSKASFTVSPDSAWLAYDDYDYDSQKHILKVIQPDGANPVELVSFAGGNVYPLIWSPDARQLAFAHSSTDANFNPLSQVYAIGRDGLNMKQVYLGTAVGGLVYSPDGKYLLIEETTSPTGGHLFVVNLDTLAQRILSAPGLSLDTDWYAPSWRR